MTRYARPGTALAVALAGDEARWGDVEHLLALMSDSLRWLQWSRTDAADGGRPPKLIPRPGMQMPDDDETRYGDARMSVAEAGEWLRSTGWTIPKGGD